MLAPVCVLIVSPLWGKRRKKFKSTIILSEEARTDHTEKNPSIATALTRRENKPARRKAVHNQNPRCSRDSLVLLLTVSHRLAGKMCLFRSYHLRSTIWKIRQHKPSRGGGYTKKRYKLNQSFWVNITIG